LVYKVAKKTRQTIEMKKQYPFGILSILTFSLCLEVVLRIMHFGPYLPQPVQAVYCTPSNWVPDETLGYMHRAGSLTCESNGLPFNISNLKNNSRYTGCLDNDSMQGKIHIYGCSLTWGQALNDSATMAWKIQEKLPQFEVQNFGIGAGSNVQSYLWLKENIEQGDIPDIVILNYVSFHDMRNCMNWQWRKVWQSIIKEIIIEKKVGFYDLNLPYARIDKDTLSISYLKKDAILNQLPFIKYCAMMNLLNNSWNKFKDRSIDEVLITRLLIQDFKTLCDAHDIKLVINGLLPDEQTATALATFSNMGVYTNNIGLDFINNDLYNLQPYDGHPNELANDSFAIKTLDFLLKKNLINESPLLLPKDSSNLNILQVTN
jgi:hypothetical protein